MLKTALWIAGVVALIVAVFGVNTARQAARYTVVDEPPDARAQRLSAHWTLVRPEGPGPFPAAILLSGCDGVRDNMAYWAGMFAARGRAALIVDSHTPRGMHRLEAWRLICAGQALTGAERAGDVAVALEALAGMQDVTDDVILFGASHGGWTAMEFVADAVSRRLPPGLTDWPAPPDALLARLSGLVLFYPYCGLMNGADALRWARAVPGLMILAERDSIVSTPGCMSRAQTLQDRGARIETAVLPGADHGFDQQSKARFSTLVFDADQRAAARRLVEGFLDRHGL